MKQNKLTHYLLLIAILAAGIIFFYYFAAFPERQFFVVIATSVSYLIWGIVYHLMEGDLHLKIVVEYLLIALLAIVLLRGAIMR